MKHSIRFIDSGREPRVKPDPRYPDGKDIVEVGHPTCRVKLPYPAPRCGVFLVTCQQCDLTVAITAAGRPDDPRSLTMHCKGRDH